mmetsp:Transcript_33561/g.48688  ORF Transcript_33561/g.48688 Transcript_33561/m.48688 type:complete len:362 (+) Transcript_33561:39-1124(+)
MKISILLSLALSANFFVSAVSKKQKSKSGASKAISAEFNSNNNMSLADLDKDIIYWNPIRTGLLANFLNLKFVYHLSKSLNKSVVINDTRNSLVFCTIFDLPRHIPCQKVPDVPCIQHANLLNAIVTPTEEIFRSIPSGAACIRGSLYLEKIGKSREHIVRALDNDLDLKLTGQDSKFLSKFKDALGIKSGDNFTVVNWNKGTEFGVIVGNMRMSQMIAKVKENTQDSLVYIISSQNRHNPENLDFNAVGFKTFNSINGGHFLYLSDVQIFELEIVLAMEATTYLDWGMNAVHDLIESLRMKSNKTFCIDQLPYCKIRQEGKKCSDIVTFCSNYQKSTSNLLDTLKSSTSSTIHIENIEVV